MTATYAKPFTRPENLSPKQHRTVLAALGLGLFLTVLTLAWDGAAARLEPATFAAAARNDAAAALQSDVSRAMVIETANSQWTIEDTSP